MAYSIFTHNDPHGFMELMKNTGRKLCGAEKNQMFHFEKLFLQSGSRPGYHRVRKFPFEG